MAISAQLVKQLRDMTGAGMMDCKKALQETDGDIDAAAEFLQIKGMAKAAKKAGRVAAEGLVHTWINEAGNDGVLVEVNCETDFVSRNDQFKEFVANLTAVIGASSATTQEEALALDFDGQTVEDAVKEAISTIGENIQFRRFVRYNQPNGLVGTYIHAGSQIGVLLSVESSEGASDRTQAFSRDVSMHIAAMNPGFLNSDAIDADAAASQEALFTAQVKEEGKPDNIVPKIVAGKMAKWRRENSLMDQAFVKNPDLTIAQFQDETGDVKITGFTRFEVGEGIEKEESNLADEVAALQG